MLVTQNYICKEIITRENLQFEMALYRVNMNVTPLIYNTYYKFHVNMNKLHFLKGQSIKNKQFPLKYISTQRNGSLKKIITEVSHLQEYITKRKSQALKSILVQIESMKSYKDLIIYCSQFGPVENVYCYTLPKQHQFVLLEFKNLQAVRNICENATFIDNYIPSKTNVLWFRKVSNDKMKLHSKFSASKYIISKPLLVKENIIRDLIGTSSSISDQMVTLYNEYKLDELEIRLKFLTIVQLEHSFASLFPNIIIHPFGSFINGFGKRLSDLDLIFFVDGLKVENLSSRLVFHGKSTIMNEKEQVLVFMGVIADTMKYIIPGICNVRKIFNARVPIIKFHNLFTYTECDLSMSNVIATYMSELLFLYGELDSRVKPLVFTIRKWAKDNKLTNIYPGKTITNFSLTLLVIFYLQQINILPVINKMTTYSEITSEYQQDLKKVYMHYSSDDSISYTTNNADLGSLLIDLFRFYSDFNFKAKQICLQTGVAVESKHDSALYIRNPFEEGLNVSKNVSFDEVQRIKTSMLIAITNLQNTEHLKSKKWGILSILNFSDPYNSGINMSEILYKEVNKENTENNEIVKSTEEKNVNTTLSTKTTNVITNKDIVSQK
ncbi:poly(A) RNA polymerase, mitochondrial [Vespula pensylvanica]|uniref:poly(A) RNA polymerase, mitochondrial n=1 Tax=Vespula pensylvanica TaxID=30213 RepID=UPI001CBA1E6C|nr:poly(A) RNA polymerase, mitochondrial [Vespula pensylvanica]